MNTEWILLLLASLTIAAFFVSLVYVVGIVWRVEMELDISFKFLSLSVLLFLIVEVLDILPWAHETENLVVFRILKMISAFLLLLGMFFMRDLIRRMDGEKPKELEKK